MRARSVFELKGVKRKQPIKSKREGNGNGEAERGVTYPDISPALAIVRDEPPAKTKGVHAFDLEERTAKFGEAIIKFARRVPRNPTNDRLVNQLVGAGTSIGANYCEANEGVSRKDFLCSISRCKKEAKETKFFLRMIATSEPTFAAEGRILYREANELTLIFASIHRNGR